MGHGTSGKGHGMSGKRHCFGTSGNGARIHGTSGKGQGTRRKDKRGIDKMKGPGGRSQRQKRNSDLQYLSKAKLRIVLRKWK
jgi:hypothetical protein